MSHAVGHFNVMERATQTELAVELRRDLTIRDFIDVERAWGPARLDILTRLDTANVPRAKWPQSWHWDWNRKASELPLLATTAFGAWSLRGPEVVMLTKTSPYQARLAPDQGKPVVYVDFLEVAPWNWTVPALAQEPMITGLGSQMIAVAVGLSVMEEFGGRVALHSLPQSEAWYTKRGFTNLGPDPHKEGLAYFELSAADAASLYKPKGGSL